jgi:hypothetical protein
LAPVLSNGASAATISNSQSGLGINLQNVNYYSQEQPFLNIFKTTGVSKANPGFQTLRGYTGNTNEGAYVQTDANGYPTTLTPSSGASNPAPFTAVGTIFLTNLPQSNAGTGPNYPAGQYVILYDGQGTISVTLDAKLVSSAPGRVVFNVASPSNSGVGLWITATDPNKTGNYVRNIRVAQAGYESLLNAGAIFNPTFLSVVQNFRVLRGMQWLEIDNDGGVLTNWSQRPQVTDGGWGGPNGTPVEVLLELCNAAGADCWLNIPHMATNDYITQMATLAHAMLGTSQKAYVEFSNEVWNGTYPQSTYATAQGKLTWPSAGSSADYGLNWYGMKAAQTCDIWKSVWGADASRVVCVMGAQAAVAWTATQALECSLWTGAGNAPCSSHGIGAVAIAPYFGYDVPAAPDLNTLFTSITASLVSVSGWEASYKAALAPFKLPFIAYEGGQGLVAIAGGAAEALYIAANRDPRMAAAYTTAFNDWKTNGGQTYVAYADISKPSNFGEWGALESLLDTVKPLSSAPPKWQAIQNFISTNQCWWAGCTGAIGTTSSATPAAPTNLTVK